MTGRSRTRKQNDLSRPLSPGHLCLVCPLSDCFDKSSGCLHRPENKTRGMDLLEGRENREKRFGHE